MNRYHIYDDIEIIRELLDLSIEELAEKIGVAASTIHRWKANEEQISAKSLRAVYEFAFQKKIRLNRIKAQLYQEECPPGHVVLFHGAKTSIDGPLSIERSREANDFGRGFYCGESLEQSAMFVSNFPDSSLYILDFDKKDLTSLTFGVERDWMLTIAYFRKRMEDYARHPMIQALISRLEEVDYVAAPIADNRMFQIIDSFIDGEITDIQCQHCLSATNLGNQYVFLSQKALDQVRILRRCYLTPSEKQDYLSAKKEDSQVGRDKVKIARKQYRNQGQYIEDILL